MKLEIIVRKEVLTVKSAKVEFLENFAIIYVPKEREVIVDLLEMGIPFQTGEYLEFSVDILSIDKMETEEES